MINTLYINWKIIVIKIQSLYIGNEISHKLANKWLIFIKNQSLYIVKGTKDQNPIVIHYLNYKHYKYGNRMKQRIKSNCYSLFLIINIINTEPEWNKGSKSNCYSLFLITNIINIETEINLWSKLKIVGIISSNNIRIISVYNRYGIN